MKGFLWATELYGASILDLPLAGISPFVGFVAEQMRRFVFAQPYDCYCMSDALAPS